MMCADPCDHAKQRHRVRWTPNALIRHHALLASGNARAPHASQSSVRQLTCQADGREHRQIGSRLRTGRLQRGSSEALAVNQHRRPTRGMRFRIASTTAWPDAAPDILWEPFWEPCGGDAKRCSSRLRSLAIRTELEVLTRLVYMVRSFLHLPIPPAKVTSQARGRSRLAKL
jgi:hypothetical protein